MSPLRIESIDPSATGKAGTVVGLLSEFSSERSFKHSPAEFALALMADDQIVGGLIGHTNWDWMHIEVLAVDRRYRGCCHGRSLVERAEMLAKEKGCVGAWVDTFTFQAPGFYEHIGYRQFGMLPSYPDAERRLFYSKRF